MLKKILPAFLIISLLLFQCGCSTSIKNGQKKFPETDKTIPLITGWPHEDTDLHPDPALVFGTCPNGLRYVLMENQEPKNRVSLHLNVQAGSLHEEDHQQGGAHFLEHMLFNGTEHFKPGELVKYFQSIGMRFGGDANAHTGFFETVYDVVLPDGSKENLEKGFLVLKDYAKGALLLEEEVDRERKIILAEKRDRDSASYRTFVSSIKFELPGTRIIERFPIGIEETINSADREVLKDFYDIWYSPKNMILVAVGDFDSKLVGSIIENSFSGIQARAPEQQHPSLGWFKHKGMNAFYHFEKEAGSTTIRIETLRKVTHEPDSIELQHKELVRDIANQIIQNRLDAMVSKPDNPFTSANIDSGVYLREIEYAEISAECSPENWEKTLLLLEKTLRKSLSFKFTQSELERVKKDYIAFLDAEVKRASTRKSQHLSRQIIRHINNGKVFQSPAQVKKMFVPVIEGLTIEEVHRSFVKTWKQKHRLVLVTGNADLKGDGRTPEELIIDVMDRSSLVEVFPEPDKKVPVFPYLPDPVKKGDIKSRRVIDDLGIIQIDFANNIRLNLKKTDFKANEVLVNIAFGRGKSGEPVGKPGLSALTGSVMNESGLGSLDSDELEQALAGKNVSMIVDIEEEYFLLKGTSTSEEVPLIFQLAYAYINDPGFRGDAYLLAMERFKQLYETLSHKIEGGMKLSGDQFLAGGDSRFGLPPLHGFKKNSLSDVEEWVGTALENQELEVSVVGDFDIEQTIETASLYIGSLTPGRKDADTVDPRVPIFPVGQSLDINVSTDLPKGRIVVTYPTDDFWDINRTRRLSLLGEVFSERLRENIREKLGAAYSQHAYNRSTRAYPGYGLFYAIVNVAPGDADTVISAVQEIAGDLVANGITEDELRRALDPVITHLKDIRRTNRYWLGSVLTGSKRYPCQLDWSRTIMEDYASISADDLTLVARKYFNNKKSAVIRIRPEK